MSLEDKIVTTTHLKAAEELLTKELVIDWIKEHKRYAIIATSMGVTLARDIAQYKDKEEVPIANEEEATKLIEEWSSSVETSEFEVTVWFNEELRIRALGTEEYRERVRIKRVMKKNEIERDELTKNNESNKSNKSNKKKSSLDWDDLEERLLCNEQTIEEVAAELNCSVAAVRRQAHIKEIVLPKRKRGRRKI